MTRWKTRLSSTTNTRIGVLLTSGSSIPYKDDNAKWPACGIVEPGSRFVFEVRTNFFP
jgi:hypothetical protein